MDCDVQVEFGSPEYLGRAFGSARAARVPMNGVFDLTYRCNFGCVHCYVGHLVGSPARRPARSIPSRPCAYCARPRTLVA